MASKKQTDASIPLELPSVGYAKSMLFNRFAMEKEDEFRIIYFAYVSRFNVAVDQFACAVSSNDIQNQKATNMDYLGKLGGLETQEMAAWQPPSIPQNICLVNQISMCRFDQSAEIALHSFSIKAVLDHAALGLSTKLEATPVAILRSNIILHKHFIRLLFTE